MYNITIEISKGQNLKKGVNNYIAKRGDSDLQTVCKAHQGRKAEIL